MSTTSWQRIFTLFEEAVELAPEERAQFLDRECDDSDDIRLGVEELLAAEGRGDSFFDRPLVERPWQAEVEAEDAEDRALGAPPSNAGSLSPPKRFGAYRVLRQIGQGGMSTVHLAVRSDDAFKRQVVVKLVRRGMESAAMLQRLRTERQILASLDHPNVARLFDGGSTEEGLPYFVMEYVDGVPIDDYCRYNSLTLDERLNLFRKVCEAVHYAHQNLVVHRDIKPSNILVTVDGEPKLLDFGIAKLLNPDMASAEAEPTATWQRVLTPSYASPEQVRGKHITTASDVYSLGVLLYKLLTGRLPRSFKGRSQKEIEQLLTETEPLPPSAAILLPPEDKPASGSPPPPGFGHDDDETLDLPVSRIPDPARRLRGDLDAIVLKALRSAPTKRYGSVEKLAEDIENYQCGRPVTAHAGSWRYRAAKFVRRHRTAVAVTGAVAILLVAFVAAMVWQSSRVAHQRDQARIERDEKQAVLGLILDIFQLSNPYALAAGGDLTVLEALERSVPVLESRLGGQSDVRAELLYTAGSILSVLGSYQPAAAQLEEALALRQSLHGDGHPAVVENLAALAKVRTFLATDASELDAAEALIERGVEIARELDDDETLALALTALVSVRCYRSEYDEAEIPAREALEKAQKLPEGHPQEISALQFMALIHSRQGDYRDAAELNRQALARLRKLYGERHPIQINTLNNLGLALRRQNEFESAESAYQEILDIQRESFGEDYRDPISFSNLGGARLGRSDYPGAEEIYRLALAAALDSHGSEHWRVYFYKLAIAQTWIGQGKAAEAQEEIERLLRRWRPELGEDNWRINKGESVLGESISLQGRCQEAKPHLVESYEKLLGRSTTKHRHRADAFERLRDHLERCGQSQEIARFEDLLNSPE